MISRASVVVFLSVMYLNMMHAQSTEPLAGNPKSADSSEVNTYKPLQVELRRILDEDQKYRVQLDSVQKNYGPQSEQMANLWNSIHQIDSINVIKVKAIIAKYGWVGADRVGEGASRAIWAVIQHADSATQATYLPVMREAVRKGNADASQLALLEDRVALRAGRRQIYGTQLKKLPETGELYVPFLDDPDNVDKRRAEVGLGTLAEYLKSWGITWNVEEYKKKFPDLAKPQ